MALAIAVPLAAFTTGLSAQPRERGFLRRRPGLAARALLAILVLVPAWTLLFVRVLHPSQVITEGLFIVILAVGMGPVTAMKRMAVPPLQARYAFELNLLVLSLSIAFLPLAVALLSAIHHRNLDLGPAQVAKVVLFKALVPMALGALVARALPAFSDRARRYLALTVNLTLAAVVVFALLATWRELLAVGTRGWLAAAGVALGAISIGHVLGGPERETRTVLASASTLRFPALALMLASLTERPRLVVAEVLVYLVVSLALMGLYGLLVKSAPAVRGPAVERGA